MVRLGEKGAASGIDVQEIAEDAQREDGYGKGIASPALIATEKSADDLVVVLLARSNAGRRAASENETGTGVGARHLLPEDGIERD